MDEQSGDELRSLRQRAYGPNADIHEDPAAMERLRHLEAQVQVEPRPRDGVEPGWAPEPVDDEPTPDEPAYDAGVEPVAVDALDPAPVQGEDIDPDPIRSDRPRRRGALIWAGALTGALLVGAALSYVAVGLTPGSVGVLQPDPDGEWPDEFTPRDEGSQIFESFYGVTVVLVPQDWSGGSPSPCLFILTDPSASLIGGAGCGAGDFEPVAAISVTAQMPESLVEEFPVGTALQFQLRDGEVVVYVDPP